MEPAPGDRIRLEYMPLRTLAKFPRNPKAHNLPGMERSFYRFGFNDPMCIDERTGQLVEGNGRTEGLEQLRDAGKMLRATSKPGTATGGCR